ncbi:CHASE domain-containing protein, partial [Candidatus Sumerlaeota bacterium]|nr:CHASE domain-containing protein [Candidatus Sumerlaeota bacterium]
RDQTMAVAIERAMATREYSITEKMAIPRRGDGFSIIIPIERQGNIEGFVFGFFLHASLLNNLLLPELRGDFEIELKQANQRIYDSYMFSAESRPGLSPGENQSMRTVEDFFFVGPQLWAVKVRSMGFPHSQTSFFTSDMILTLGTILAFIISAFVYHQQRQISKFVSEAWVTRSRLASTGLSLAQIQENFDLILNNVNEGIVLYDEDWRPLQANIAFKQAFGATGNPFLFEHPEEHHREMAVRFKNEAQYWGLLNTLKENPERPLSDEIEFRLSDDPTRTRYFQRWASSVCRPDGSRRGYLVIYQDITPAKNVEKLKEDFLSSVTHDLRTPLASIKGFAETMLRNPKMDAGTRDEFAAIIRDESTRLEEMIEDLLDLRRMEAGRFDLTLGTYNMKALAEEIIRSFKPILDANELKVDVRWEGDHSRPMFGDVAKIGRALRNIISNSIKYSPGRTTISIRGIENHERAEVEIADEGPGIPPDDLPYIFEKFYRGAHHVRRTKGTGLGLAIVKHIIESHGGIVNAQNAEPKGTAIKIILPRKFDPSRPLDSRDAEDEDHSITPAETLSAVHDA